MGAVRGFQATMADRDSSASESSPREDDLFAPPFPARIVIQPRRTSSTVLSETPNDRSVAPLEISVPSLVATGLSSTVHQIPSTSGDLQRHDRWVSFSPSPKRPLATRPTVNRIRDEQRMIETAQKRFCGRSNVSDDWRYSPSLSLVSRRVLSEPNIASILFNRELPGMCGKRNNTPLSVKDREIYSAVAPNYTVFDIHHPPIFMRKFSPDGLHLVGFSSDLQSLLIYRYQGAGAVGKFFMDPDARMDTEQAQQPLQRDIFTTLFQEKFRLRLIPEANHPHLSCRDFSLYTMDSNYVLLATTGPAEIGEEDGLEVRKTNESLPIHHRSPLEDYRFILVNLKTGKLSDQLDFLVDKIQISHNVGVYLCGNILAILSTQHQRIHLYKISKGKMLPNRILGQYCFGEMDTGQTMWNALYPLVSPADEVFMSTMKQKLFMEFYRVALKDAKETNSYGPVMEFHRLHTFYKRLKMWKFQMLDEDRLLIKWAPEDVVINRASDPTNYPQFFGFFDMRICSFYAIYDHREEKMLKIYEKHRDFFRNPPAQHPNFQADSFYSREVYERVKRLTLSAKNSGPREACSRLLAQLPLPCQSYTSSPYVDMSLYQYDTSLISNTERVKTKSDEPIRFYTRETGTLRFTLHMSRSPVGRRSKRFVTHIFHPTDPLIITCEKPGVLIIDTDIHVHIRRPV